MKKYKVEGNMVPARFFSKEQRKDDKLVKRTSKNYLRFQKALDEWNDFKKDIILPIFNKKLSIRDGDQTMNGGDKGITIYDISREERIKIKKPLYIRMSDLAMQAKKIIEEKIKQYEDKLPQDMVDLFSLLKGMFLEKRKVCYTPSIAAFVSMKNIKDKDLLKAQELLRESLKSDWGRLSVSWERLQEDGSWGSDGK